MILLLSSQQCSFSFAVRQDLTLIFLGTNISFIQEVTPINIITWYAGFSWHGVNFHHSSLYGVMVCICAGNRQDRDVFIIAEQGFMEPRLFLFLSPPQQQPCCECIRVERGHTGREQLSPADPRGYYRPDRPCLAYKAVGRRGKEGTLRVMVFFPQVSIAHDGARFSWRWNTSLPMGRGEWILCFASTFCMAFVILSHKFFHFSSSYSPIHYGEVRRWLSRA